MIITLLNVVKLKVRLLYKTLFFIACGGRNGVSLFVVDAIGWRDKDLKL